VTHDAPDGAVSLRAMSDPAEWRAHPFLFVVRGGDGAAAELGVMFDAFGLYGWTGFSATVFLSDLTPLPATPDELAGTPRETFDTLEELLAAGWRAE
jgi:hypothetical protein